MARWWVCLVVALSLAPLSAQTSDVQASTQSVIDWAQGRFFITLKAPLVPAGDMAAPKRRFLTEQQLTAKLEEEFVKEAGKIPVDSSHTLADLMAEDPSVTGRLTELVPNLRFHYSRVDEDYTTLEMRWSAGLWSDLGTLLDEVNQANPLPRLVAWSPSRDFSGVVIFAMGNLPWLGTGKLSAAWTPALSLRLLSPDGEVLYDRSMTEADALAKWGQAGLSLGKFNEEAWRERIGFDPLRIVARGVFGKNPTDLVLSRDDWDRLLARPANRDLLAQGKILILWGPFPDYTVQPNPDSAIDETQPRVQVIPQAPIPAPEKTTSGGAE